MHETEQRMSDLASLLRDFGQGASNAAASNVTGPVDALAWALRKIGVPVPSNPILGSEWMRQKGLLADPRNKLAGLLGESAGLSAPIAVAAKAPQIARGLLGADDALTAGANRLADHFETSAIKSPGNREGGMIRTSFGRIPETSAEIDALTAALQKRADALGIPYQSGSSNVSGSRYLTFPRDGADSVQVRISNHADNYPNQLAGVGERFSVDPSSGNTIELAKQWLKDSGVNLDARVKKKAVEYVDDATLERIIGLSVDEMNKRGIYESMKNSFGKKP